MKVTNHRYIQKQIPKVYPTVFVLLLAIFTVTTANAQGHSSCEHEVMEPTIWEKTKFYSAEVWDDTKELSQQTWSKTEAFLNQDDNGTWAAITGSGIGMVAGGLGATTTTSILGIATITTAPVWAPVAICAGTAAAAAGGTYFLVKELTDE